ncbi:MAG: DUF6282 family protein, partial [Dehalococcoidia bacterium]
DSRTERRSQMPPVEHKIRELVREAYDLHLHVGPDILPRRYNVRNLIQEEEGKIAGVALKSHSFPTISAIADVKQQREDGLKLIGSITLNYFMGGFNPSAIYASTVMSREFPLIVWFPTVHAWNHLKHNYSEYEIPPEWVKDPLFRPRRKTELKAIRVSDDINNRLFEKCTKVLNMVRRLDCIIATGHLSWPEAEALTIEALDMGCKVILTHPMQKDIDMPLEVQIRLARLGAMVEFCYIMYLDRDDPQDYPLDLMAKYINEIGARHCILSSDAGQRHNPGPSESLRAFAGLLCKEGIALEQLEIMMVRNPRYLIGLEGRENEERNPDP